MAVATIDTLAPGRKVLLINYDPAHFGVTAQGVSWQFVNWQRLPINWQEEFRNVDIIMIGPGGPISFELEKLQEFCRVSEDRVWRLPYREAEFRFLLLTEGAA